MLSDVASRRLAATAATPKPVSWPDAEVRPRAFASCPANCIIGRGSLIYEQCHIICDHGEFRMGQDSHLAVGEYVKAARDRVILGDGVALGPRAIQLSYTN